jgi:crotonobetainyl-CoA:carnitine CoA-transferase CaiB-like acyl-CoA transferase
MLPVRLLDLSGGIGAYCSKLLADLGADVVIAEPPGGDDLRRRPPFKSNVATRESLLFASYHANKRGITLDCTRRDALPLLEALGASVDIVIVSPTRRRPVVGFDRDAPSLAWAQSDAIVAAITPFGLTGPLRDLRMTPVLSFAMNGGMHWVGDPNGAPHAAPCQLAWDEAGIHAAFGILAALSARPRIGGQLLDLSVHEVGAEKDLLFERYDVAPPGEWGRHIPVGYPPTGVWECADGPLAIAVYQEHHWAAFLATLDEPPELSDPIYADALFRRQVYDMLEDLIAPLMAKGSRVDLFRRAHEFGLPCAPNNTEGEFVQDALPEARKTFVPVRVGETTARIPWRWCHASVPLIELKRPAPGLGEHNGEIYCDELGFGAEALAAWQEHGIV